MANVLEFFFVMYLIGSSVKLLRRFVIDHSSHNANERTAWLHIFMICFVFGGGLFYNCTQIVAHIASVQSSEHLDDFDKIIRIGSIIKLTCNFISSCLLIYMLKGFASATQEIKKKKKTC